MALRCNDLKRMNAIAFSQGRTVLSSIYEIQNVGYFYYALVGYVRSKLPQFVDFDQDTRTTLITSRLLRSKYKQSFIARWDNRYQRLVLWTECAAVDGACHTDRGWKIKIAAMIFKLRL